MNARSKNYAVVFWGYLVFLVLVVATIYLAGDRVWWGTLLMFGPRWVWGIPIPFLLLFFRRMSRVCRWSLLVAAGLFVYFGMGFNLPIPFFTNSNTPAARLMTLNMAGGNVDWNRLQRLIDEFQPEVLLLQECPANIGSRLAPDWNTIQDGELAIASRYSLTSERIINRRLDHRYPRAIGMVARIQLPTGSVPVGTVYLLSPSEGLNQILSRKTILNLQHRALIDQSIEWRRQEADHVFNSLQNLSDTLILAGDFNMPVESTIYRRTWGNFKNAFSWSGFGIGPTTYQTRAGIQTSARIDHVLFADRWQSRHCWVGPDVGSDHRPVFADLIPVR